ncbi:hypothetical protein F5Y09DRAFT_343487 [Xylaria sp. FL1042]|nr:hypothetical protein F5Y09DRAFT_343487 [Xylaria sp. FL1042]
MEIRPRRIAAAATLPIPVLPGPRPSGKRLPKDSPFATTTETADVLAGSEVGFRVSWDDNGQYGVFSHPGPGQVYLSRAPDNHLESFRGDEGDWFKIAYAGPGAR